jgi:hypothetical protein
MHGLKLAWQGKARLWKVFWLGSMMVAVLSYLSLHAIQRLSELSWRDYQICSMENVERNPPGWLNRINSDARAVREWRKAADAHSRPLQAMAGTIAAIEVLCWPILLLIVFRNRANVKHPSSYAAIGMIGLFLIAGLWHSALIFVVNNQMSDEEGCAHEGRNCGAIQRELCLLSR